MESLALTIKRENNDCPGKAHYQQSLFVFHSKRCSKNSLSYHLQIIAETLSRAKRANSIVRRSVYLTHDLKQKNTLLHAFYPFLSYKMINLIPSPQKKNKGLGEITKNKRKTGGKKSKSREEYFQHVLQATRPPTVEFQLIIQYVSKKSLSI